MIPPLWTLEGSQLFSVNSKSLLLPHPKELSQSPIGYISLCFFDVLVLFEW